MESGEVCQLCSSLGDLIEVSDQDHLDVLDFLKATRLGDRVCQACFSSKIKFIVSLRGSSCAKAKEEKAEEFSEDDDEDVNLEELDQLSSYYAELENDPDFVPKRSSASRSKIKRLKKVEKIELKCQICDAAFSRIIALRRHFINDHEDVEKSEWRCRQCDEEFLDKTALIGHVIKSHVAINQCKKCGKKFRLARSLRNHIAHYCPQISGNQKSCDVCDKLMPQNMLASHRTFSHVCPNCSHILPNRREKCKHLREVHKVTKSLKFSSKSHNCKRCSQSFSSSYLLGEHLVAKHPDDQELVTPCPHPGCKMIFPRASLRLRSHLKKLHNNDSTKVYKYECQDCFSRFKSAEILKCHIQTKHDESHGKVKCPFCPYALPTKRKSDLYRHHYRVAHPELTADLIKAHDEKLAKWKADLATRAKIQCLMCSFGGVKSSNMARHYVDVHGYDPTIADAPDADDEMPDGALCTECGEIFINRHGLMRHLIKAHSKPGGEQCLYCPFRYNDILVHIDNVHADKKANVDEQVCRKCVPVQKFHDFHDLLKHTKSYHRKKPLANSTSPKKALKVKKLCENCGKLVKHKSSECPKILEDQEVQDQDPEKKKYVPVHLSGTCPFCEYKFADLLGHIRHGHATEKSSSKANTCPLCSETFGSVRELVSHRQLHPQFKQHSCSKCSLEFETVVELRAHRSKQCTKSKKAKKTLQQNLEDPSAAIGSNPALATLMKMANTIDKDDDQAQVHSPFKAKPVEYEGRGSVSCHLCKKSFIMKTLLKRHYVTAHNYDPNRKATAASVNKEHVAANPGNVNKDHVASSSGSVNKETCAECNKTFTDFNEAIKHHLDSHALVSGLICPYCDCKYGSKKFDDLDGHVGKYHVLEMQSPVQTCGTCKTNFNSYESLKVHRQIHEGGNRPRVLVDVTSGEELISVHPRVGAKPEISNRGGLKCQLCNAFKLRKDHLKLHYIRYHGYDPKAVLSSSGKSTGGESHLNIDDTSMQGVLDIEESKLECPSCHSMFDNNHFLIKHLLKVHCVYSGLICPYCRGHFPSRFIDLQSHVTAHHMDQLTGYNICNRCKVCQKQFSGYAELRDHVQLHGDGYKDALFTQSKKQQQKKAKTSQPSILRRSTKILVPVATDSNGQMRVSSEALQKAILMATQQNGGQIKSFPQDGLVIGRSDLIGENEDSDAEGPLAGILDYK